MHQLYQYHMVLNQLILILLVLYTFLARRLSAVVQQNKLIKMVPGVTLLALGFYALGRYFLLTA